MLCETAGACFKKMGGESKKWLVIESKVELKGTTQLSNYILALNQNLCLEASLFMRKKALVCIHSLAGLIN